MPTTEILRSAQNDRFGCVTLSAAKGLKKSIPAWPGQKILRWFMSLPNGAQNDRQSSQINYSNGWPVK